jgi:hypothetical protein
MLSGSWRRLHPRSYFFLALLMAEPCAGGSTRRPLFEPTDLELEDPGVIDFDFQLGLVRGQDNWRVVNPDFEFDFGVTRNLELDVDGTYAITGTTASPFAHPQALPDALWTSAKLGLVDWVEGNTKRAWALGVQVGPKLPIARGNRGIGAEGLALLGFTTGNCHFVLNTGLLIDPRPSADSPRPIGIEMGLDVNLGLDRQQKYALTGELGAVRYLTSYPHELLSTVGFLFSPSEYLDVSVVSLLGWLNGSDRYGLLFGLSPKLRLFGNSRG